MSTSFTSVCDHSSLPEYDLSVITVCRNALGSLRGTTDSVLAQKEKATLRIEHIIVDGNSDDGTKEWLQEQQACGTIESFISEPDCGIYDAMNKGINMAHGRVLAFLNAEDTYTEQDLYPCIAPILEGHTQHTMAAARIVAPFTGEQIAIQQYNPSNIFAITPGCHQAYFATAAAYRSHGGYMAQQFRCCADGMFMNTLSAESGAPVAIPYIIVNYTDGGFSTGCGITFAEEFIELQWHFRKQAHQKAEGDPAYARALARHLLCNYRHIAIKHVSADTFPASVTDHLQDLTNDITGLPIGEPARQLLFRLKKLSTTATTDADSKKHFISLATGRRVRLCERYLLQLQPSYSKAIMEELASMLSYPLRVLHRKLHRLNTRHEQTPSADKTA